MYSPSKQLRQGLQQLAEEGATQVFFPERSNDIILGAVGVLQFDVVASRLKEEYKVECSYEPITVYSARWIDCDDKKKLEEFRGLNKKSFIPALRHLAFSSGWALAVKPTTQQAPIPR